MNGRKYNLVVKRTDFRSSQFWVQILTLLLRESWVLNPSVLQSPHWWCQGDVLPYLLQRLWWGSLTWRHHSVHTVLILNGKFSICAAPSTWLQNWMPVRVHEHVAFLSFLALGGEGILRWKGEISMVRKCSPFLPPQRFLMREQK